MDVDAPISTTPQNIIVSISKTNGTTLSTTKTFQVKRDFTPDEDIAAIKTIFDNKMNNNDPSLLIKLPRSSTGSIINNPTNKNAVERKVRIAIDPSNINGDPNHPSLRGTTITLTGVVTNSRVNDLISFSFKYIIITISKTLGTSVNFRWFVVGKDVIK